MLKKNVGAADRVIRAILGVALIGAYFMYPDLSWKWAALVVGLILLFTSVMSSCLIYTILGMRTNKSDE